MALPAAGSIKPEAFTELRESQGDEAVLNSLLRYFPDEAERIRSLSDAQGSSAVLDSLIRRMSSPFGSIYDPDTAAYRPTTEVERTELEKLAQPKPLGPARPRVVEPEAVAVEKPGLDADALRLVSEAADTGLRTFPQPGKAAISKIIEAEQKFVGRPLRRFGEKYVAPVIERAMAKRIISPEDVRQMLKERTVPVKVRTQMWSMGLAIPAKDLDNPAIIMSEAARYGLLPPAEAIGVDFLTGLVDAQEGTRRTATANLILRMFNDNTSAVWEGKERFGRRRELEFAADHPILAAPREAEKVLFKLALGDEDPITLVKNPENLLHLGLALAAGHYVVAPVAGKVTAAVLRKWPAIGRVATMDLTDALKRWLKFKKMPASPEAVADLLMNLRNANVASHITIDGVPGDNPVVLDFLQQFSARMAGMSDDQINLISKQMFRVVKGSKGNELRVFVPRNRLGEFMPFGATEARPFYPPTVKVPPAGERAAGIPPVEAPIAKVPAVAAGAQGEFFPVVPVDATLAERAAGVPPVPVGEAAVPTPELIEQLPAVVPEEPVAPPVEPPVVEEPVVPLKPVSERPVTVVKRTPSGKIDVLPGKKSLLEEIDRAIAAAPEAATLAPEEGAAVDLEQAGKIEFKIDGGVNVFNTKETLQVFRKRVAAMPEKMERALYRKLPVPKPVVAKREEIGALIKGAPEGYFTDGKMIVKGTPPKTAKFSTLRRIDEPSLVTDRLNLPTLSAQPQYYLSIFEEDIGISNVPIASLRGLQKERIVPNAIFKSGDNYYAFNQNKLNVIRKRYPDARYGINPENGQLVAYVKDEPVAALMPVQLPDQEIAMTDPPGLVDAIDMGLVEDVARAEKDVESLKDLGYVDDEIEQVGGVESQELIDDNIPADEVEIQPDGTANRQAGAREPRPETGTTEDLTAANMKEQERIHNEKSEAGFFRFRKHRKQGTPRSQVYTASKSVMGDTQFADDLYAGRDANALWERIKAQAGSVWRDVDEVIHAEADRYIKKAAQSGRYVKPVSDKLMQFHSIRRTHFQTVGTRGRTLARRDAYGMWGELDMEQQETLENLIAAASIKYRTSKGLPEIADVDPEQADAIFRMLYGTADEEVRQAFNRYDKFQKAFSYQHLVDRGKLDPSRVMQFYAPHQRLDYLWGTGPSPFRITVPLKPRFRGYLKKAAGSEKPFAVGLDNIETQLGVVYADNLLDDFAIDTLTDMDATVRQAITDEVGEQRAKELFASIQPNQSIIIGDARYMVTQYEPGRYMFPAMSANETLLREALEDAALDSDRLFALTDSEIGEKLMKHFWTAGPPPDDPTLRDIAEAAGELLYRTPEEQERMIASYLEDVGPRGGNVLRRVIALGRYKPMYVVPQEVFWRIRNLRTKRNYMPLLRQITKLTSGWKTLTLNWAGIPYHLFQALFVDTPMMALTDPKSVKALPTAAKIIRNLPKLTRDPSALGPEIQETFQLAHDQDVFGSGFLREYMHVSPNWSDPKEWGRSLQRWGALRESLNRVGMLHYQWHDRYKKGLPFEAIHFEKDIEGLTPEQAGGYIARNFTTDFESTPDWFRHYLRGFILPFITGSYKGANILGRLLLKMPQKRLGRFLLGVVAPIAAIQIWNNTGWRKKIRDRLGWSGGRWYTTILKAWDDDNDGEEDRVLIWSPRTNIDEAGEWIGVDSMLQKLHGLRRKKEAGTLTNDDLKEFANEQIQDSFKATPEKLNELLNPLIQFGEGWIANRDPFTRKQVVPPEVKDTPAERRYMVEYFARKMMTPIEQLARSQKGGRVPQAGPAGAPTLLRRMAGAVIHGPLNAFRGLGFSIVDLNNVRRSEQAAVEQKLRKLHTVYKKQLRNEFVDSGDVRIPEGIIEFYDQLQTELTNIDNPDHEPSKLGRILRDARARGVDLTKPITDSPREKGSIRNMLISPLTWGYKYRQTLQSGINPATGKKLTDAEKTDLRNTINALSDIYQVQDFKTIPVGIRAELLEELLPIYGITVDEFEAAFQQQGQ